MADIVVVGNNVGMVFPLAGDLAYSAITAVAVTRGQAVYKNASGKLELSDASASGTAKFWGIALETKGAGEVVSVCRRGHLGGFTLAGAYQTAVYLSDTAGALSDTVGTVTLQVGKVENLTDRALTKILIIDSLFVV